MSERFEQAARRDGLVLDAGQRAVAARLTELGEALERGGRRRWFGRAAAEPVRGVYLWGSVGRGKSWLSDTLFATVRIEEKRRLHFHEFFRQFHAAYARHKDESRAGELAVAELIGDCRFLYFDEFHVHDAGDAMLMGRVVGTLLERGTTLLATSNYPPSGLLPNPVFHPLFEPTIALLERSLDVVGLTDGPDYRAAGASSRARTGFAGGRYLWHADGAEETEGSPTPPLPQERRAVPVAHGTVEALAVRDDLVWFDFTELCDRPNSTIDYLALTDAHRRWVVSGLPRLTEAGRDAAQRFANLVDVLCDRDVELTLIGRTSLADALTGEGLPTDIDRTASRLSLLAQEPTPAADPASR
ncbi:cell division protein ZapE [Streptomyces sp. NPDC048629]|uniref:cell division protein ZapE n=1 Tax=Streptomyces sp. NPDC048629 TaxID=3154824 RepID=UPI00344AC765